MTDGKQDNPNVTVGGFAVKGRGSRTQARSAGDKVTSALARLSADIGQRDFPGPAGGLGNVRIRMSHDSNAKEIEQALRAALQGTRRR